MERLEVKVTDSILVDAARLNSKLHDLESGLFRLLIETMNREIELEASMTPEEWARHKEQEARNHIRRLDHLFWRDYEILEMYRKMAHVRVVVEVDPPMPNWIRYDTDEGFGMSEKD
jgi:hypothetical protein